MKLVPWNIQEKDEFLDMQFNAQHKFYQDTFTAANFELVIFENQRIGRLYIDRRDTEIRVIDIALLSEFRGQGIGENLMQEILDEAHTHGKSVTIHVEKENPAMTLYTRLGFNEVEDQGVYRLMEWRAQSLNTVNI